MTNDLRQRLLLVVDDREFVGGEVRRLVGSRRFGDIILKRRSLSEHFRACIPEWARSRLIHLRSRDDLAQLRHLIETGSGDAAAFVVAGRAGFMDGERLAQLVERLPYAEEDFTDRRYRPLLAYWHDAHRLVEHWSEFEAAPIHLWDRGWADSLRVESALPVDLGNIREFLTYSAGSTATRHFNLLSVDEYYYTKSSADKSKILAEYSFYGLAPERMRPWLIEPFDYRDDGRRASYRMIRYFLADAALQWVHGAFDVETFEAFIERLLFFLAERPRRACPSARASQVANELFVAKLKARVASLLGTEEGRRINRLAASATPELELERQLERFLALYARHEAAFIVDHLVVGHGDPCFSNVLYDQQRRLLKLIDPRGAVTEEELWTHPMYDLCKISHSVLGDYDFINNGLCAVGLSGTNDLTLRIDYENQPALKECFVGCLEARGHDPRIVRLGEVSLFLSMLPLHIDHPNKVIAFMLKAKEILDEVEDGR